ncbi:MAG: C2HC-type zinc finger protein [Rhabdochlamydiaceae bacterium]
MSEQKSVSVSVTEEVTPSTASQSTHVLSENEKNLYLLLEESQKKLLSLADSQRQLNELLAEKEATAAQQRVSIGLSTPTRKRTDSDVTEEETEVFMKNPAVHVDHNTLLASSSSSNNTMSSSSSLSSLPCLKVKGPDLFTGEDVKVDTQEWVNYTELWLSTSKESEKEKLTKVLMYLRGRASTSITALKAQVEMKGKTFEWLHVKNGLLDLNPRISEKLARSKMSTLNQGDKETVQEMANKYLLLDKYIKDSSDGDRVERFKLCLTFATTLESLLVTEYELDPYKNKSYRKTPRGNERTFFPNSVAVSNISSCDVFEGDTDDDENDSETSSGPSSSAELKLTQATPSRAGRNSNGNKQRRRRLPSIPEGMAQKEFEELLQDGKCFTCKEAGHRMFNCPKKNKQGGTNQSKKAQATRK